MTCGHTATEEFCAHCGEKRHQDHDISFLHLGAEALEAFFHLDSKLFLTLRTLTTKPGKLTEEFFFGRRKPYMTPLQVFLVCNLIFFFLQPLTGLEVLAPPLRSHTGNSYYGALATRLVDRQLAKNHISRSQEKEFLDYQARFYRTAHVQARSLVILMVPIFALVLALLFVFSRRYFMEHLIFALHFYSWWLLWVLAVLASCSVLILSMRASGHPLSGAVIDQIGVFLEVGGFAAYLCFALRAYYKLRLVWAIPMAILLGFSGYYIMHLYRFVLFFTTLYST